MSTENLKVADNACLVVSICSTTTVFDERGSRFSNRTLAESAFSHGFIKLDIWGINVWNKSNKEILSNLKTRELTREELITVFNQNHAARNHARQMKNSVFDLPKDFKANIDERVEFYVDWLLKQKSKGNLNVQETMQYLLFDDNINLEERVYNTIYNPKYHIEHFGRSIVGELIGWGRPEITHLRNNRVNKGLRTLGFNVALFSD